MCTLKPGLATKSFGNAKCFGGHDGFSLIELMVGIVISLICTLAIMAAFAVFEGNKRTTSAGDDAQQNGSYGLYYLERQIRTAGSGIVQGSGWNLWGCPLDATTNNVVQLNGALAPSATVPFNAWPTNTRATSVMIAAGSPVATVSDVIGVISGSPSGKVFVGRVTGTPSATQVTLDNAFGIQLGDYLLGVLTTGRCALARASSIPNANMISLDAANSTAAGLTNAAYVFDMGPDPTLSLYGVDPATSSLVSLDLLGRTPNGQPAGNVGIADGIYMLKALYGIADGSCGSDTNFICKWASPSDTNWSIGTINASKTSAKAAMVQIKAIRVAVVAQSRISQRSSDYTGPTSLILFKDLPAAQQITITTDPTYRYKVYDTIIPIRNMLITKFY